MTIVDLPGAGRADDGVGLARRHVQVEAGRGPGAPSAVGEVDVVEVHLAPHRLGQGGGAGDDGRRHGEQVEDAPGRGHGPLVEVEGLAQTGERPEQPLGHVDEHREEADLEVAAAARPGRPTSSVTVKPARIAMRMTGTKADDRRMASRLASR